VFVSVANAAHGLVRVPADGQPTNSGEHVSGVNYRRTDALGTNSALVKASIHEWQTKKRADAFPLNA